MKTRIAFGVLAALALTVSAVLSVSALAQHLPGAIALVVRSPATTALVLAAVVLHVLGHVLRAAKHRLLLVGIRPIGFMQVFRGQMIGFAFNALLPLRIGDAMRAHYVGRSVQVSRAAVLATVLLERALDLGVVLALGAAALLFEARPPTLPLTTVLVASAAVLVLLVVVLAVSSLQPRWFLVAVHRTTALLDRGPRDRVRHVVWSFSHALGYALPTRRALVRYLLLTVAMWAVYVSSMALAAVALLPDLTRALLGVSTAPFFGVSTWLGPAYLGEFLGRAQGVLGTWVPEAGSAPFVVVAWCLLVVPSVLLGVVCLRHRRLVEHLEGSVPAALTRNKLYREEATSSEFAHLLDAHFQGDALGRIVSREETAGRFTVLRALKGGSAASTLLVWQDGEIVVKKVSLPAHRSKLDSQFDWLASRADAAEIVDVVGRYDGGDHVDIDIRYREGYVPYFEYLHATSREAAWSVLEDVIRFMDERVYQPVRVQGRDRILDQYIATKLVQKVLDTGEVSPAVSQLLGHERVEVNGTSYRNLLAVVERIRAHGAALADLLEFQQEVVHGDLTVDNLMVDPITGSFLIIDPNDENLVSDRLVDYAKILQSLHSGYEFLVEQRSVVVDGARILFEDRRSAQYEYLQLRCASLFERLLTPARRRALLFHEAVHYCRMLTYRAAIDSSTVGMYYGIATRLLNEFLDQYEHEGAESGARDEGVGAAITV